MSEHHIHGPSSLHQREICPYSGVVEPLAGSYDTEHTIRGTKLHDAIEHMKFDHLEQDEQDACAWCLDKLDQIYEKYGRPKQILNEQKLELKNQKGELVNFGSADKVLLYDEFLIVIDYKFGRSYVNGCNNIQLKNYALAAMQTFGYTKAKYCVLQPVGNNFSGGDIEFTWDEVNAIESLINASMNATEDDANPSLGNCEFCNGKNICSKSQEIKYDVVERNDFDVATATPIECEEQLEKIDLVRKMLDQFENQLIDRHRNVGDLDNIFELKEKWKNGIVRFEDVVQYVTIEALIPHLDLQKGVVERAFADMLYQGRGKGKVTKAALKEKIGGIYKQIKQSKSKRTGEVEIRRKRRK